MSTAYVVVTLVAAAMSAFSAVVTLTRAGFVVKAMRDYGVPEAWWPWLGAAKAAGAAGLVAGFAVPPLGVAAAIGLILYYLGAVIAVVRAKFPSHAPFPLVYLAPVAASLALL